MKNLIIKNQKSLDKITKKELKNDLSLYTALKEKYTGNIEISLYELGKEKTLLCSEVLEMKSKNHIYHITEEIRKSLKTGSKYLYEVKTEDEIGEYIFKVERGNIDK